MKLRNIILTTVLLATFSACEDMFEPAKEIIAVLRKCFQILLCCGTFGVRICYATV